LLRGREEQEGKRTMEKRTENQKRNGKKEIDEAIFLLRRTPTKLYILTANPIAHFSLMLGDATEGL